MKLRRVGPRAPPPPGERESRENGKRDYDERNEWCVSSCHLSLVKEGGSARGLIDDDTLQFEKKGPEEKNPRLPMEWVQCLVARNFEKKMLSAPAFMETTLPLHKRRGRRDLDYGSQMHVEMVESYELQERGTRRSWNSLSKKKSLNKFSHSKVGDRMKLKKLSIDAYSKMYSRSS